MGSDLIEYGTGISSIIELFLKNGLSAPTFENFQHGFMVTVFAKKVVDSIISKNELENELENESSLREKNIIQLISRNSRITQKQLSKEIGITPQNIRIYISKLKQKGILRRIGPDKGGHWEVISEK